MAEADAARELGVGVIGYGAMGKAHAYGYTAAPVMYELAWRPRLQLMCGRHGEAVSKAAASLGFAEWTTDWHSVVEDPTVDLVDICTPPGTHAEIVAAAARNGKAVLCEKPLAVSLKQAVSASAAVRRSGTLAAICFNYRFLPAVALMRELVASGEIGDVLLWRGTWLSDEFLDPEIAFDWRFERDMGGTTIGDLGCHLVDLATWMLGPIAEVSAQSSTFVKERSDPHGGGKVAVQIDDASSALLSFSNGASGVLEVARTCARRPCDFVVEVNGTRGTIVFDYSRLNELRIGRVSDEQTLYGMRTVRAEHPEHPYAKAWWAIGQGVGYGASFVNLIAGLLAAWPAGPFEPGIETGLEVQRVCDAIERSAAERRWVSPAETAGLGCGPIAKEVQG